MGTACHVHLEKFSKTMYVYADKELFYNQMVAASILVTLALVVASLSNFTMEYADAEQDISEIRQQTFVSYNAHQGFL